MALIKRIDKAVYYKEENMTLKIEETINNKKYVYWISGNKVDVETFTDKLPSNHTEAPGKITKKLIKTGVEFGCYIYRKQ